MADGYPKDNVVNADVYSAATPADSNVNWGGTAYTFYSANYIDYLNDNSLIVDRSRMAIAQDVITDLVDSNPSVDFALGTFNYNAGGGANGGRIIRRLIPNMTATDRTSLMGIVDGLTASGNTPLCETYYEAYRYITGNTVLYGDDRNPTYDSPDRDRLADSSGRYIAPTSDCAYIYVIMMTDGEPTGDTGANNAIETLTGKDCRRWADGFGGTAENCLPELAEYMANNDLDGDDTNGEQLAITYTVGFATDQPLLEETARLGEGQYYTATSADALAEAFRGALLDILKKDSSFTAPGVAVDSFNRTQSRNEVYYAMFRPDEKVDWRGNVKKFAVQTISGKPVIVDQGGDPAFDPLDGGFKDTASSYWSSNDGGFVDRGGVGGLLAARDPATRTIYTNTGTAGALEIFNSSNLTPDAFGQPNRQDMWQQEFGVDNVNDFNAVIAWAQGYNTNVAPPYVTTRAWVMGDVIHSQPIPVNYGALGSFDEDNPDQRILVGTNSGFVHMFGNDNGQEDWAFFPKELSSVLNKRRLNAVSSDNVYGVDLTPSVYRQDVNKDGTIDASDGDKAWAYFGLRRGGPYLFALDISNPDLPAFMWQASPFVTGLSELGLTWSRPVVGRIPGYSDANGPKPVVIFGAGYDLNKDSSGVGTPDSIGRGVFILDAVTGDLVRSITPDTGTFTNVQESGLLHSVPGEVATLDSNGDELVDRLYFADTGGNVWRVDIGARLPTAAAPTETWFVTKLAALNEGTTATDRRFFNKPDVVRVTLDGEPVDFVLLGSGDRTNPLGEDVNNFFYLLRDRQTTNFNTAYNSATDCDPDVPANLPLDYRCSLPIQHSSLFDITSDVLNNGSDTAIQLAQEALGLSPGWRFELVGDGEKNLSDSVTLSGTVVFSTFTPDNVTTGINICAPVPGQGKRYFIDIFDGEREEVQTPPGEIPPSAPLYVSADGSTSILVPPPPDDSDDPNDPPKFDCRDGLCTGFGRHPLPYGNYWYSEEY
ncbi:MAG: PilC/PilY family type IV pilus protein [Halioglobus sp.]